MASKTKPKPTAPKPIEDNQGSHGWNCPDCGTFVSINYIRCTCCDRWK